MKRVLLTSVVVLVFSGMLLAAPGWQVTKPPVAGGLGGGATGPDNDPFAVQGQWFIARQSPLPQPPNRIGQQVRTWEFYDDSIPQGGGFASFLAIKSGTVTYYDRDNGAGYGSGPDGILDTFGIQIIVTNDCPAASPRPPGGNLHAETWTSGPQWICNMKEVKVTAEFSIDINNGFPAGAANPPYVPPGNIVYQAVNHDELAWYCENADPLANFWVPTWDLEDIGHDLSAGVEMQFYVGNAGILAPGMPLPNWLNATQDKFYNRTPSLKISDWVSPLFGPGAPYDNDILEFSNVSVFFVPEPVTLGLLLAGGVVLMRRRR
jgi:hypothetical protein